METAGPRIILDRLREEWHDVDEETDDELKLEKQLWVLTALQLQILDNSAAPTQDSPGQLLRVPSTTQPIGHKKKILELYSNIAEVYQLSAMQARAKIYYLSTKPQGQVTLPANVSYLSVPLAGSAPFPYAASSFNHIRASSLPSFVPSAKLPQVFRECYRLLAPGGVLEIRLMDSCPDRQTAGPKMRMWMEDRVSLNLEKSFRCSRPCMLVPTWVEEAGFSLENKDSESTTQKLQIPTAVDSTDGAVNDELFTLVGRALWKDVWGEFVDDVPGEPKWFWEDESIMEECLARKTVIECCTLFAFKQ
ncbi:uncharacterized protein BDZ99DRAFT_256990 [Mytilinidion resinicola]|uniref:Methyltransferase type 11 domain-containing protein n=1 Tax=Mytilinidion resinicola TaxID=574789 RepID=A0A6A6YYG0_9PEZI|nr:uncharacterized protein BDZ99DRAFT_256990 [Mytilinidion resinicola]KAF2813473.1 hypothetical protein BDZ99DRAFT_256990 [Mytilinidion resinicola]